jgi:hypothetical protein
VILEATPKAAIRTVPSSVTEISGVEALIGTAVARGSVPPRIGGGVTSGAETLTGTAVARGSVPPRTGGAVMAVLGVGMELDRA